MPAKTKHKISASRTGRRSKKRTPGRQSACKGRKESSSASAIIADSIFTVRFKERSGPEVFCALEKVDTNDFEKMYHDLWKAWINLKYRLTGERSKFNAASAGVSISVYLNYILTDIRQLIPAEFEFNIEQDTKTGEYYIMLYRFCEWYHCWHYIEVGLTLIKLKKENRALYDLFLSFLRIFNLRAADLWDSGLMGSSLDNMDDRIINLEDELDPEDLDAYYACLTDYGGGEPKDYCSLIRKAKVYKPAELKKRANRFKANPIANLIFQGTDLFLEANQIQDYRYLPGDEEDNYYLDLESQINIIWKENDLLYDEHCEHLDAIANEGMQEPVLSIRVDAGILKIDFAELNKKSHWPDKLTDFIERAQKLINSYTNE